MSDLALAKAGSRMVPGSAAMLMVPPVVTASPDVPAVLEVALPPELSVLGPPPEHEETTAVCATSSRARKTKERIRGLIVLLPSLP
jgi:hypothetical protein